VVSCTLDLSMTSLRLDSHMQSILEEIAAACRTTTGTIYHFALECTVWVSAAVLV